MHLLKGEYSNPLQSFFFFFLMFSSLLCNEFVERMPKIISKERPKSLRASVLRFCKIVFSTSETILAI